MGDEENPKPDILSESLTPAERTGRTCISNKRIHCCFCQVLRVRPIGLHALGQLQVRCKAGEATIKTILARIDGSNQSQNEETHGFWFIQEEHHPWQLLSSYIKRRVKSGYA